MNMMRARCHPQRPWACYLDRGAQVVAVDGALRLRWREPAIDDLDGMLPMRVVMLGEGDAHRFDETVRVEIEAVREPAMALVMPPPARAPSALVRWLLALSRRVLAVRPNPS